MTDAAEMRFFMPKTVADVAGLLAQGEEYRCLAGGGLVVPALREGPRPAGLISLKRVAGLRGITRQNDGAVWIGAMTPHADVMKSELLADGLALIGRAAAEIAHPVIRNMATIGGTVCRADPCADYSCALLAAGAAIHLQSSDSERVLVIEEFATGDGMTARRDDELLTAVSLPGGVGATGGYARFSRVDGDFPIATAAVWLNWRDAVVTSARVAIGGCGPTAFRAHDGETLLIGVERLDDVSPDVTEAAIATARPVSDIKGSADYRRMLIPGLLRRALSQAFAGANR